MNTPYTILNDFKQVAKELHNQLGDRTHKEVEFDDGLLIAVKCPFSSKESWDVESTPTDNLCGCCGQSLASLYESFDAKAEAAVEMAEEMAFESARGN